MMQRLYRGLSFRISRNMLTFTGGNNSLGISRVRRVALVVRWIPLIGFITSWGCG